jgi:hypothetical protein
MDPEPMTTTAVRFAAFDLDGTLLDTMDRPLAGVTEAIAALGRLGIVSFLATGRSPVSLRAAGLDQPLLRVLHPRMVVSDGDGVLDRGSRLFRPLRWLPGIIRDRLLGAGLTDVATEVDGQYHANSRRAALGVAMAYRIPRANVVVTPGLAQEGRITRVMVFGASGDLVSLLDGIRHTARRLRAFDATLLRPPGTNKARALTALLRLEFGERGLGRVIAFGDGATDAELLKSARLGIAVQNSEPLAVKAADRQLAEPLTSYLHGVIGRSATAGLEAWSDPDV